MNEKRLRDFVSEKRNGPDDRVNLSFRNDQLDEDFSIFSRNKIVDDTAGDLA
jgi:hypothetical protein